MFIGHPVYYQSDYYTPNPDISKTLFFGFFNTTLQNYKTTKLQNYKTTKLQHYNNTTLQHYKTTKLQHYKRQMRFCFSATLTKEISKTHKFENISKKCEDLKKP